MALATGTLALYFDSTKCATKTTDGAGSYNLTETGTVPYADNGQPVGNRSAGLFTASDYFRVSSSLGTLMNSTPNSWTIQAYLYVDNLTTFSCLTSQPGGTFIFLGINATTGEIRKDLGGTVQSGTANFGTGSWKHWAVTWDGTNCKFYINNALDKSGASNSAWPSPSGNGYIGLWQAGGLPMAGYVNQLRFMNTVETSFPTTDPSPSNGYGDILQRRRRRK